MPTHAYVETGIAEWLEASRRRCDMSVRQIPWRASREWRFDGASLYHESGGFFRLVGAQHPSLPNQPLIDQPEIGILGFLLRHRDGRREICVQAKPEPGNVGLVQIAPSVQATESNYRQLHGGRPTPLLAHFVAPSPGSVVAESLQSEQGTRFLGKRNRNMVVEADTDVESDLLRWFGLADVLKLLATDFLVNTDARSVLAVCPWDVLVDEPFGRWRGHGGFGAALLRSYERPESLSDEEVVARLAAVREEPTEVVGLGGLEGWTLADEGIRRDDATGFRVCHFDVTTTQREIDHWDQPLIAEQGHGNAVLLCREQDGILELAFRPRHEIGFLNGAQFGPSVQDEEEVPASRPALSCLHSDEGGRFFQCVASYAVRMMEEEMSEREDEALVWMTLGQVARLIQQEGLFTNQARSLVSMLLTYL